MSQSLLNHCFTPSIVPLVFLFIFFFNIYLSPRKEYKGGGSIWNDGLSNAKQDVAVEKEEPYAYTQEGSERNQKCNDNLRLRTLVTSENHSGRRWTTYMIEKE